MDDRLTVIFGGRGTCDRLVDHDQRIGPPFRPFSFVSGITEDFIMVMYVGFEHLSYITYFCHRNIKFETTKFSNYFSYTSRGSPITCALSDEENPNWETVQMSILMLQLVTLSFSVQTMEPVDQLLQCVDPAKDRELWVRENKTGEVRPVDIEIWPQCYPVLTPRLTLIQELHAWGLTEFCAGFLTALTDPSVTPNRLRDDRTAPHPISFLLRMMSVFGVFSARTLSDEWRCRIVAGHSFLGVKADAKPRRHMETGVNCEVNDQEEHLTPVHVE